MEDSKKNVNVGEIWFADLGKKEGSIQGGERPVIIIAKSGPSHVHIVPLTTKVAKKNYPMHVAFSVSDGLEENSTALTEQLGLIDLALLKFKIADVTAQKMDLLKKALLVQMGIDEISINVGEIWFADLGEKVGSEQGGERPVIIFGKSGSSVNIIPLTSKVKKSYPMHVDFSVSDGLKEDSTALLEQLTTVDVSRLMYKLAVVTPSKMKLLQKAFLIQGGIKIPPNF
ncbi:type II toxin-antitoxin system PemK/MazF family toxin [Paenibacillus lemnae]|uniref:Type II toxin-antitoxin system PemK/MazF family toxin n=1 Tax=Paenibacillus lemnae TaxID=1330551 RepID=A0A848M8D0_PAELE|nr:type II toxin-antitoxin system PemK/MazF family toxin [Paenibacillus lemnae]